MEPLQIFLRLHGSKLNHKLIRLDFEATQWVFHFERDFLGGSKSFFCN